MSENLGRRTLDVEAVFDIETEDWTHFRLGAISHQGKVNVYRDEDRFFDALLRIEGRVYAHNLGRFDGLWGLDCCRRRGIETKVIPSGARIVTFQTGKTQFCDSFAICPMGLAEWTGSKSETGLPCICPEGCGCSLGCYERDAKGCGGYCSIKKDMPARDWRRLTEYLVNDVRILEGKALGELEGLGEELDLDLCLTIGSSAWSNAQRLLGLPDAPWKRRTYEALRKALYGGRCQKFRERLSHGYQADVNSMYPGQMATQPMPVGEMEQQFGSWAAKSYRDGRPGIYRAVVYVPESFIPPLPLHVVDKEKTPRVAYPFGKFEGVWADIELRAAEEQGAKILKFEGDSFVFERREILFKPWVERIFAARAKYGKKSWQGKFLKLYPNAFSGKCSMRPGRMHTVFSPPPEKVKRWNAKVCAKRCGGIAKCEGFCGYHQKVRDDVYNVATYWIQPCAHVEWGVFILAGARVQLGGHLREGGEDAAMCDTDSVFSENRRVKGVGVDLGQLADKGPIRNLFVIAPKVYTGEELTKDGWEPFFAAKGVSDPKFNWEAIEAEQTVSSQRMRGYGRGLRMDEFFARDTLTRTIKKGYGDRVKDGNLTRAQHVSAFKVEV